MCFTDAAFPVDDQLIPWGSTLDDAKALLPGRPWWPPYGGWANLRGPCRGVCGLAATALNLRAPTRRKPVLQAIYQLAPPPAHASDGPASPTYWLEALWAVLGRPAEAGACGSKWHTGPGSVVYAAKWALGPVEVALSVYGGIRAERGGRCGAGLYVDYRGLVALAPPYLAVAESQTAALEAGGPPAAGWLITTEQAQTPTMPTGLHYPDTVADQFRQSYRALYYEGLCETPAFWQKQLTERQVVLWAVPGQPGTWAVSMRHDTVLLSAAAPPPATLDILTPARGGGAVSLRLGGLRLHDAYGSSALEELARRMREGAGIPVEQSEYPDC